MSAIQRSLSGVNWGPPYVACDSWNRASTYERDCVEEPPPLILLALTHLGYSLCSTKLMGMRSGLTPLEIPSPSTETRGWGERKQECCVLGYTDPHESFYHIELGRRGEGARDAQARRLSLYYWDLIDFPNFFSSAQCPQEYLQRF